MAPFTGGMVVFNAALIDYVEACILLVLFGVWPGFLVWLAFRKVVRPWLDSRRSVTPYVHVEAAPKPEPDLTFPGAERLKLARVTRSGAGASRA